MVRHKIVATAVSTHLWKDLVDNGDIDNNAGDAMMGVVPNCTDYDWKQEKFNCTYSLWGAKTQGEPYILPGDSATRQ
ncbi:MAG: hypothetical protein K2M91_02645 [Lachnospiraceae bacterium]|nr:hypothetical protein [Lachnospiraceae bacterium]